MNLRRIKRASDETKRRGRAREGNFIFLHPGRRLTASFITGWPFDRDIHESSRVATQSRDSSGCPRQQPYANYQLPPPRRPPPSRRPCARAPCVSPCSICRQKTSVNCTGCRAIYLGEHLGDIRSKAISAHSELLRISPLRRGASCNPRRVTRRIIFTDFKLSRYGRVDSFNYAA